MKQGWIALHRKLLDNPIWETETFTRGQAWVDLLLLANHKDGTIIVRDHIIKIKRGQVGWSENRLASKWKWSRTKTKNFLKYLETEQQIVVDRSKSSSVITVLNYEKYQEKEQQESNRKATEKQQEDTNNNVNNEDNEKNISKDIGGKPPEYGDVFVNKIQRFFKEKYPLTLQGVQDRKRLHNVKQIMTPRKNKDEWYDPDPWENFKRFIVAYFQYQPDDQYKVRSIYKLLEMMKLWRENEGVLVNERLEEDKRVEFMQQQQQEWVKLKALEKKKYENI
jgi:hypothetical protein